MEINDLKNKILEKLKEGSLEDADVASILRKDSAIVKDGQNSSDQELSALKKTLDEKYRGLITEYDFRVSKALFPPGLDPGHFQIGYAV